MTDLDEAELVELLGRDVIATLSAAHLDVVQSTARSHRRIADDPASYVDRVVEDFQLGELGGSRLRPR